MPDRSYEFVQLDVFTKTPLAANPLAIFTDARGLDGLWGMYQWLDRAPKGRNDTGVWWRRHDEYKNERARRNCPNSELPSSNLDQFFVSPLGGAKKRLGASDLTRGLHGHSCLRVRVGTMELAKWDKSPTKLQQCERARHNCPNSELPSSNLDQF